MVPQAIGAGILLFLTVDVFITVFHAAGVVAYTACDHEAQAASWREIDPHQDGRI